MGRLEQERRCLPRFAHERAHTQYVAHAKRFVQAVAANVEANFLKVVASAIVDKYIGESARVIREMFGYAREHEPCIIFMDEIDAIGGRRFSEGTSADREIQRTLMEVRRVPASSADSRFNNVRVIAAESNGWIRCSRQSQDHHGDEPPRHARPCLDAAWSTRPQGEPCLDRSVGRDCDCCCARSKYPCQMSRHDWRS
jgi:hypothetical protein